MQTQEDQTNNVIDIRTQQHLLPKQMRSVLKGQFVESSDMEHTPDQFIALLEQRLLGELARTTINFTKNMIEEYSNKGKK